MNKRLKKFLLVLAIGIIITGIELVISLLIPRFGWTIETDLREYEGDKYGVDYTYQKTIKTADYVNYLYHSDNEDEIVIALQNSKNNNAYSIFLTDGSIVDVDGSTISTTQGDYTSISEYLELSYMDGKEIVVGVIRGDTTKDKLRWFLIYAIMNVWAISLLLLTKDELKRKNQLAFSPKKDEPITFIIYKVTAGIILLGVLTMVLSVW